jgi:hypothetical protein
MTFIFFGKTGKSAGTSVCLMSWTGLTKHEQVPNFQTPLDVYFFFGNSGVRPREYAIIIPITASSIRKGENINAMESSSFPPTTTTDESPFEWKDEIMESEEIDQNDTADEKLHALHQHEVDFHMPYPMESGIFVSSTMKS